MRLVCLLGFTIAPALAACPYAQDAGVHVGSSANPHANLARDTIPTGETPAVGSATASSAAGKKGVMLMNRISPAKSKLYIANADGTNERPLLKNPVYEYHADFSPDAQWISFTSERNGDGNSDIWRVRPDGSDLQPIVTSPAVEDSAVISPNGTLVAYVSTANNFEANIWIKDLDTGTEWNITDTPANRADPDMMHGNFRPAWSPDGEWIAFSSDRNTIWDGHGRPSFNGLAGWEHTQELAIYVIRPDGSDLRLVTNRTRYSLGSPKWSPDEERLVFYEMTRNATYDAHRPESLANTSSAIVSIRLDGTDRRVEVDGPNVKTFPQYVTNTTIGYHVKGGQNDGLYHTDGTCYTADIRSPSWSPDGKLVVYEKVDWSVRPLYKKLYSWDNDWDYRFTYVFPQLSSDELIAVTHRQHGDASILTFDTNGNEVLSVYSSSDSDLIYRASATHNERGAYYPSWSPDGDWIAFGVGSWFDERDVHGGWIMRSTANGSYTEVLVDSQLNLTDGGKLNSGFPSFSPDGKKLVYRVWGPNTLMHNDGTEIGLRILDLETRKITQLTSSWDNLPSFSQDGKLILFTRKINPTNYDICTIRADGTDLRVLTTSGANDAHAVWRQDGKIMWSSGMYGFRCECALYDRTFQPYGQIMIMDPDGSNKRPLTNSIWEDSMPLFLTRDGF
ncbi:WD40-like Beta Propeller [Penicillium bovifimosum]|uniref:WD40-like Beta Propeller n=1 Tax=Penicillium bovifimosum TaxID=126998 RepID=A0A9W9L7B0_9EURO|nr:WD40-like Beta Propeller [Penicillium bovifimosum]KAJ5142860.1 WD40-like Beta Propeller [Penicillium bovifimosum]